MCIPYLKLLTEWNLITFSYIFHAGTYIFDVHIHTYIVYTQNLVCTPWRISHSLANTFDRDCFALVGAHQHGITMHNQELMQDGWDKYIIQPMGEGK